MRAVLMAVLLAVLVAAQRAPCTGTFVDLDGRPIGGATVTFVQELSQTFGLDPDRVEVATDGNGRFAGELLLGSPYVVWAIGPSDPSGARLLTGIAMSAAGGKQIALVAERRAAPSRIDLRGVTAWKAHLPPALRVLVGAQYALGPDRPLPGDGVFLVGPWPDDVAVLALVDDKRQVVCYSEPIAAVEPIAMPPVVEFRRPRTIDCEAVDDAGRAAAEVDLEVLVAPPKWWLTAPDPLPGLVLPIRRQVGKTNVEGRTDVVVPWEEDPEQRSIRIVATRAGHGASVSGYVGDKRYCDGQSDDRDGTPMQFVMRPNAQRVLQLQGLADGELAHALLAAAFTYRFQSGMGTGDLLVPATVHKSELTALVPAASPGAQLYLRLAGRSGLPPQRIAYGGLLRADGAADLAQLREPQFVIVTTDGTPVPFAQVAITVRTTGYSRRWFDRCVTDGRGRLRVRASESDWIVVATDGQSLGATTLDAPDANGEVRLVLEPMPFVSLRVLDVEGRPLAGAHLAWDAWPKVVERTENPNAGQYGRASCVRSMLGAARSDQHGQIRLPLPAGPVSEVTLQHGGLRSRKIVLDVNSKVVEVVLF